MLDKTRRDYYFPESGAEENAAEKRECTACPEESASRAMRGDEKRNRARARSSPTIAVVIGHQRRPVDATSGSSPSLLRWPLRWPRPEQARRGSLVVAGASIGRLVFSEVSNQRGDGLAFAEGEGERRKKRPTRVYGRGALQRGQGKMPGEGGGGTERARKRERHRLTYTEERRERRERRGDGLTDGRKDRRIGRRARQEEGRGRESRGGRERRIEEEKGNKKPRSQVHGQEIRKAKVEVGDNGENKEGGWR